METVYWPRLRSALPAGAEAMDDVFPVAAEDPQSGSHAEGPSRVIAMGLEVGAAYRNRTDDLFITSESLCRLS